MSDEEKEVYKQRAGQEKIKAAVAASRMTGFMVFQQEKYRERKASRPWEKIDLSEASRAVAEEWKSMSDEEKEVYKQRAGGNVAS